MPARQTLASLIALLAALWVLEAKDEQKAPYAPLNNQLAQRKETLRRVLPEDKFQFVELVEQGRADWLASACRQRPL